MASPVTSFRGATPQRWQPSWQRWPLTQTCAGEWVRQAERDQGLRGGLTTDERERMKALEREVRELRQANEILRKASAYFAQAELDRRWKP